MYERRSKVVVTQVVKVLFGLQLTGLRPNGNGFPIKPSVFLTTLNLGLPAIT